MESSIVIVGGFSNTLEIFRLNINRNDIKETSLVHESSIECEANPAFLDMVDDNLYVVHELSSFLGEESGGLTYYKRDATKLTKIMSHLSSGTNPCHLEINASLKCAYISNYGSGHFSVIKLKDWKPSGSLFIDHFDESSCVHESQHLSHPHGAYCVGKHIYVTDLGADKIWHYKHDDGNTNNICEAQPAFTKTPPGSGPRHLAFHGNKLAFLITELSNELIVYEVNESNGSLKCLSSYKFLENNYDGENYGAEIMIHPNGKFIYLSNRKNGCIISYEIVDATTGKLKQIQCFPLMGTWPRHFNIHKSGLILLCADQFKDCIEMLCINGSTGVLTNIQVVQCPNKPSCLIFAQ